VDASIEVLSRDIPRGRFRHVLFDFDGTVSLIREGWRDVMVAMMTRVLSAAPEAGPPDELEATVTAFVSDLTGEQTVYQMLRLRDEVAKRGGEPLDALEYKRRYLDLLLDRIRDRREGLRAGAVPAADMLVPGVLDMLRTLRDRGLTLHCASGTDEPRMREEASLLNVASFFGTRCYGALDDYRQFSKKMLIERIIQENGLRGGEFLTFGDGRVEIRETKRAGGVAVGVASDEKARKGIDAWKRERLIEAGADIVVPDFRETDRLVAFLFEAG